MRLPFVAALLPLLLACADEKGGEEGWSLAGDWSGLLVVGGSELAATLALSDGEDAAVGTGTLDCTPYAGEPCSQAFAVQILRIEGEEDEEGNQGLSVELSECMATRPAGTNEFSCTNPDPVYWDGADQMVGLWSSGELTLDRS